MAVRFRATATLAALFTIVAVAGCDRERDTRASEAATVELGSALFHDRQLSADRTISCGSCHRPERYFADGLPKSRGVNGRTGTRNAPSLLDVAFVTSFFWDGRERDLRRVVVQAFTNPVEMGQPGEAGVLALVNANPRYRALGTRAFDRDRLTMADLGHALARYVRTLPRGATRLDRANAGASMLSQDEMRGQRLFDGKAGCGECHVSTGNPAPLTDNRYHHAGIGFEQVAGRVNDSLKRLDLDRAAGRPLGQMILADPTASELGRFAATRSPRDLGSFRTPSLRNVTRTAPYMHDGSVGSLEAAIDQEIYYRSLARGRPITLTVAEQAQLRSFLRTFETLPADSARQH